jgi:two-component system response regulator NreC
MRFWSDLRCYVCLRIDVRLAAPLSSPYTRCVAACRVWCKAFPVGGDDMPRIRILLVDHHAIVRAALRLFINAQPDMEVVGEAKDDRSALAKARETKPDVTVLEIDMPGTRGIRAIGRLLQECSETRVVVLTLHDDPAYMRSALAAGSSGYVTKHVAASELLAAIRSVYEGHTFLDPALAGPLLHELLGKEACRHLAAPGTPRSVLSARECEVLIRLAQGYTNRQIAEQIHVSVKSVDNYRARIGQKLELRGRAELIRYAHESGLLTPNRFLSPGDAPASK